MRWIIAEWDEWLRHQYDPGYWIGARRALPNRTARVLIPSGILFGLASLLLIVTHAGIEETLASVAFAVLQLTAGARLLRRH